MFIRAAHAATKITVGRCRWWGLHKFGVPIKMISLSLSLGTGSSAELPTDAASGALWAMIRRGGEDDGRAHFAAKHKKAFID